MATAAMTISTTSRLRWCCNQFAQSVIMEVSGDPISHPLDLGLAEYAGGLQDEQQDEQAKGKNVLPL